MSNPERERSLSPKAIWQPRLLKRQNPRVTQRGFSLLELMVGITIGLLVVIAAIGSLVYTQVTAAAVGDSDRLQQKADLAFRNMGFHISQAGAINLRVPNTADPAKVAFDTAFTGYDPSVTLASTSQIFEVHGVNGDGTAVSLAPDTLRVSYQDDGVTRDCLGNQPAAALTNIRLDNEFSVASGNLVCLGKSSGAVAQPIADGVEDFQVTFGVLTVAAGANRFQWYRPDQVLDWTNIQAVNICLQLAGDNKGNPRQGAAFTGCRGQTVSNDGLLRRVFWRTYSLRNALL